MLGRDSADEYLLEHQPVNVIRVMSDTALSAVMSINPETPEPNLLHMAWYEEKAATRGIQEAGEVGRFRDRSS